MCHSGYGPNCCGGGRGCLEGACREPVWRKPVGRGGERGGVEAVGLKRTSATNLSFLPKNRVITFLTIIVS